jgi:hypothetical protein
VATDNDAPAEPVPCSPCRSTGKVISNLGGSPTTIDCPWCDGTGAYTPGHDAQARHRESPPEQAAEAAD